MLDIPLESPNRPIVGRLKYESEIRFGPRYYSLHIQNLGSLKRKLFGHSYLWSDDSRYIALQEWMTIKEADGPWTRLLLIDFQTNRGSYVASAKGGFIKPTKFENDKIVYSKEFQTTSNEFEVAITSIGNWEHLDWI